MTESRRRTRSRLAAIAALLAIGAAAAPNAARAEWPPKKFTNLQVLPKDIAPRDLIDRMAGFTRALGVRCTFCHIGDEDQPLSTYHFADDDKPTKRTARVMMRMVADLNATYLPRVGNRAAPPVAVECATCHRGVTEPRPLQDVLALAYATGGLDSTIALYRSLRDRYYGRAAYDFGEVPLADLAGRATKDGHDGDAVRLYALNVEMNPSSAFAKRQHALAALTRAFETQGADSGVSLYRTLHEAYGPAAFPEPLLNQIGYALLGAGMAEAAVAALQLNAEAFPSSGNAFDSLGEAYTKQGDTARAIESYQKSLTLDPGNENARARLKALRGESRR